MNDLGARFRQEQREREAFLRNTRNTVTEQIEAAIAEAGGSTRDALNNALAGRAAVAALLRTENEKAIALMVALKEIRAVIWPPGISFPLSTADTETIDTIACEALKIASETP